MITIRAVMSLALLVLADDVSAEQVERHGIAWHRVESGAFQHSVTAEGHLEAKNSTTVTVPVTSQRNYTIDWIATDGQPVKKGEVVVRFDRTDLERALADGEADLYTAENALLKSNSLSSAALANLARDHELAGRTLQAAEIFAPHDEGIFSRQELVESRVDAGLAREKLDHLGEEKVRRRAEAKEEVGLLSVDERKAKTSIDRATDGLSAIEVAAPHDGILLLQRDWGGNTPRAGQTVWQGQSIGKLPDVTVMEAKVHVLEADAGSLKEGLSAELVVEAHPGTGHAASVSHVDHLAKPRVRGVPVHYFGVTLDLETTDPATMKPGQRVRAELAVIDLDDVIVIPRQAVVQAEGGPTAWVLEGERAVKRRLELGAGSPGRVVVESGLAAGELVALEEPPQELAR
ncbi:MAG: HlyD family efflux transporter periplasmic adaptor subunit [Acidobacteriota bacterium]